MNIIEAREAAMAGKTVIDCIGEEWNGHALENSLNRLSTIVIFGEWSIKKEPVVFEADVSIANEKLYGSGVGMIADRELRSLIGKRVKVTVECVE